MKVTTDFAGTETLDETMHRIAALVDYWHGPGTAAGLTSWGQARGLLNSVAPTVVSIADREQAASFIDKLNMLNDPDAAMAAEIDASDDLQILFTGARALVGAWDVVRPEAVFTDTAGTTPAALGQGAARYNMRHGGRFLQAAAPAQPQMGVMPPDGIRNRANGAASGSTIYWHNGTIAGGITHALINHGIAEDGEAFQDYRLTGTPTVTQNTSLYRESFSRHLPSGAVPYRSTARVQFLVPQSGVTIRVGIFQSGAVPTIPAQWSPTTSSTTETLLTASLTAIPSFDVGTLFQVFWPVGVAIDVTVRIKGFQFEQGTARSAYQANFGPFNVTDPKIPLDDHVYYLFGDGVDNHMASAANLNLSQFTRATMIWAGEKLSDVAAFTAASHGGLDSGSIAVDKVGGNSEWSALTRETGIGSVRATQLSVPAPDKAILTATVDRVAGTVGLRYNGVAVAPNNAALTGTMRNAVLSILGRADGSTPLPGRHIGLLTCGGILPPLTLAAAERYYARRSKVTIQ